MKPLKNHRVLLAATIAWAALIITLALAPRLSYDSLAINHGVLAHMFAFALLGALLRQLLAAWQVRGTDGLSLLLSGCFGIAVEYGQHLMPPRTFDINDILLNFAAAAAGILAARLISR